MIKVDEQTFHPLLTSFVHFPQRGLTSDLYKSVTASRQHLLPENAPCLVDNGNIVIVTGKGKAKSMSALAEDNVGKVVFQRFSLLISIDSDDNL